MPIRFACRALVDSHVREVEYLRCSLKIVKPGGFTALLGKVGFSHNTLQLRIERPTAEDLAVREKPALNGFGRPKFAYHVRSKITKQVNAALEECA